MTRFRNGKTCLRKSEAIRLQSIPHLLKAETGFELVQLVLLMEACSSMPGPPCGLASLLSVDAYHIQTSLTWKVSDLESDLPRVGHTWRICSFFLLGKREFNGSWYFLHFGLWAFQNFCQNQQIKIQTSKFEWWAKFHLPSVSQRARINHLNIPSCRRREVMFVLFCFAGDKCV